MSRIGAIFRAHGDSYLQAAGTRACADQRRVIRALAACHTSALGGVRWRCPRCSEAVHIYRSCGNRHCPACGHADATLWLESQQRLLLPGVTYHLVTVTVPDGLRPVLYRFPRQTLQALFDAASSALLDLCRDPRHLGALPAVTAVLHTWTRQLLYHPHIHFLVSGGGIDPTGTWRETPPNFLVPVRALSALVTPRLRDRLHRRHPNIFSLVSAVAWRSRWVVHSKPVGAGSMALAYLARYIFRVALADSAILRHGEAEVVFRYRDSETGKPRTTCLPPQEFIHRFLHHVLPTGFRKVRHYGLYHTSRRPALRLHQAQLALRCSQTCPSPDRPALPPLPPPDCPRCRIPMAADARLPPLHRWSLQSAARGPP